MFVVVFDTNIIISAALSLHGNPFRCLALAKAGSIESVTCQEILDEVREKLRFKLNFSPDRVQVAVDELVRCSRLVPIPCALKGAVADSRDDKIIECALVGNATHLVTGDKRHLLVLHSYQGIRVVSAAEFLADVSAHSQ